jgi:hypothetical protein
MRHQALVLTLGLAAAFSAAAQDITYKKPDASGTSASLASLATEASSPGVQLHRYDIEKPSKKAGAPKSRAAQGAISALNLANTPTTFQTSLPTLPGVSVTKNFAGLGRGFNANWTDQFLVPPDPTIAVGPTQIVQWVNVRLTVMDKNGNPLVGGALGYINGNAIWSGLPPSSVCRRVNQGDPMVQYDRLADRWVLSQFAFDINSNGTPIAPFASCIAVSTSGDATGSYALYEYTFDALPDYAKLGIWPDAYYFSTNDFTINPSSGASTFVGARVCAYDRAAMIAGVPAPTQICTPRFTNRFSFLPADLDGSTLPPVGAPNYVISQDWFFFISPPYSIRLQKFKPDFANPANTTFNDGIGGALNSFIGIPFGSLLGACGDNGGVCVPQPGTVRVLDTLSMRPMYRLAYRNRAGFESLVFTHSVDPPSAAVASMHWVELRNPGSATPQVFQNGAISTPDGLNRWMGSAAMDSAGNIALGYSVSSSAVSPGIRIAGRYRADLRNTLRGELNVVTGTGAQTSTAQRWGDYSAMQIDPTDDCTFWYTQAYTSATTTRDWATRIIAFKFPNCGS